MKFISSSELNKKKWDELVTKHQGSFYSKSDFLDIMSKNWGAYINETYTKGVAICYNKILNHSKIYPPLFSKEIEFINLANSEIIKLVTKISKDFKQGSINLPQNLDLKNTITNQVYQTLKADDLKLNQQAKRMVNKAIRSGIIVNEISINQSIDLVLGILSSKINEIDKKTFTKIKTSIKHLDSKKEILTYGIYDLNRELKGGLIFHLSNQKLTYLTGACKEKERSEGGMYLCMFEAVKNALIESKTINFGGSNLANIRRFYNSFGGKDTTYYNYNWDNSAVWFKCLQKVKSLAKK